MSLFLNSPISETGITEVCTTINLSKDDLKVKVLHRHTYGSELHLSLNQEDAIFQKKMLYFQKKA